MFSKKNTSNRKPIVKRARSFRPEIECLEERRVLSVYTDLASALNGPQSILGDIKSGIDGLQGTMTAKLPIVDKSLSQMIFNQNSPPAVTEVKNAIDKI